jgi:hypothetical protein
MDGTAMRATLGPFALFILLIGTAPAWPQEKKPLNELTSHLNSPDRMKRCSAAESLSKLAQTPEAAVPGIVSYVKLEIEQAMLPETGAKRPGESRETLPVVGDEVSLARIKANPDQYTDRPFVITGGIKVSNYYNFWFDNKASDYFSFDLTPVAADGQVASEGVPVYVSRFFGTALTERVTRVEERSRDTISAVRLRCIIRSERLQGDVSNALHVIEATDWQVPSSDWKSWMPWTFESIGLGYALMLKTGHSSAQRHLLDLILDEQEFQSPKADTLLKGLAIEALLRLPAKDRSLAVKQIPTRAKRTKSAVAKAWARRTQNSLLSGRLVL